MEGCAIFGMVLAMIELCWPNRNTNGRVLWWLRSLCEPVWSSQEGSLVSVTWWLPGCSIHCSWRFWWLYVYGISMSLKSLDYKFLVVSHIRKHKWATNIIKTSRFTQSSESFLSIWTVKSTTDHYLEFPHALLEPRWICPFHSLKQSYTISSKPHPNPLFPSILFLQLYTCKCLRSRAQHPTDSSKERSTYWRGQYEQLREKPHLQMPEFGNPCRDSPGEIPST